MSEKWNGTDRRVPTIICKQEEVIMQMALDIAVIKEKIIVNYDQITSHVSSGRAWRTAIVGIGATVIINVVLFAFFFGQINRQVTINTVRLDALETHLHSHLEGNPVP